MNYWTDDTEPEALPYVEQLVLQLKADNDNLMRQRDQLREALDELLDESVELHEMHCDDRACSEVDRQEPDCFRKARVALCATEEDE